MRYDPDRLVKNVGRRIAEIRQERGLTQVALANTLRVTYQWISQIEGGQNVSVYTLARMANALMCRSMFSSRQLDRSVAVGPSVGPRGP